LDYFYLLIPQSFTEKLTLTSTILERKMQEYGILKAEIESLHEEVKLATEKDILKAY